MIRVNDLNFTYQKSQKHAIRNLNFEINEGEVFGFLGPSGAGKTTMQRLIIGLLRNYEGHIEVMGKERSAWNKDFYEEIGVAFDFPNLYLKLTAEENLKLIGAYYKNKNADIKSLIDRVGLLPDMNTHVENYSKGMKMRLNFIRSIIHNPRLMFFDEPTSGLDPVNAHIIKEMIVEQKKAGKTVFLTTHNMTLAEQLCDRVAFVVDGQIVVADSPKNLMIEHGKRVLTVEYLENDIVKSSEFCMNHLADNSDFINMLKNNNLKTMHTAEASLEDIFIKLTGRDLL